MPKHIIVRAISFILLVGATIYTISERWQAGGLLNSIASNNVEAAESRVDELIEQLKYSPDPRGRSEAAQLLGEIGDTRVAVHLCDVFLYDEDLKVRILAAEALGKIGGAQAVEPLIFILNNKVGDSPERMAELHEAIIRVLGTIKDTRAVEPLIAALLHDENSKVRSCAAEALGKIGDVQAVEPLITALKDNAPGVRSSAANAIGDIGDTRGLEPLSYALLYDPDSAVRVCAAKALGKIGGAQAVEPLIMALTDDNVSVRQTAAESLGKIGDARAIEPLITMRLHGKGMEATMAGWALVQIGKPAVEPLLVALKDPEVNIRPDIIWILGEIADPRAVDLLISALKNKDNSVRIWAARALGKIKEARAVEPLIETLGDSNYDVRIMAAWSLEQITGRYFGIDRLAFFRWRDWLKDNIMR